MQVILALAATLSGTAAWFSGRISFWLADALLIFAVVPLTLVVILPTNRRLLDPRLDRNSKAPVACRRNGAGFTRSALCWAARLQFPFSVR